MRCHQLLSACLVSLALCATAQAQLTYTIEELALLPGSAEAQVNAVNASGAAVGGTKPASGSYGSALWPAGSGTATNLATTIGRPTTVANAINGSGHIVLQALANGATDLTAHLWNGSTLTNLGKFGTGVPGFSGLGSIATAMNDAGQVVGRAWNSPTDTGTYRAFSWQGGVLTDLGLAGGCDTSEAYDINSTGQIIGRVVGGACGAVSSAVVWASAASAAVTIDSLLTTAGIPRPNGVRFATGISDSGALLVQEVVSSKGRCLIITSPPGVTVTELGWIGTDAQFLTNCSPGKINNLGEAVATQAGASDDLALLWSGGTLHDLNTLLDAPSAAAWDLESAVDITDSGTVVGVGRFNGQLRGYRATRTGGGSGSVAVSDSVGTADDKSLPFGAVTIGLGTIGTVTVTNGTAGAAAIAITDGLSAPFGIADPGDCTLTLQPTETCTITITYDPTAAVGSTDSLTLDLGGTPAVVSVSGTGRTATTSITDSISPDTDATVPFGNTVLVGGSGTATVTVRNTDLVPVNVAVNEGLAMPFSFQNATACNVTLLPNQTCVLTVVFAPAVAGAVSDAFTLDAGGIATVVSVTGAPGLPSADFQVTQSADNLVLQPGVSGSDLTTFTVTAKNNGPDPAAATVTDLLPAGLNFVSAAPGQGTYTQGTGIWDVGVLASGAQATLQIQAQAAGSASGCLLNAATVAVVAPAVDALSGNNSAGLSIGAPNCGDVAITASSIADDINFLPSDGQLGFSISHALTVRNNGPSAVSGVVLRRVSYAFSGGTNLPPQDFPIGNLAAGASIDVVIYSDDDLDASLGDSTVAWSAVVSADEPDPVPANDSDSGGYTIAGFGGSSSSGGCFIATAAYGSYLDPEVLVLRQFRDQVLLASALGRAFVGWYYRVSPPIAAYIRERDGLRLAARVALTPVVYAIKYPAPASLLLFSLTLLPVVTRRRY
ncbi:MAG: DUF11 domain-containing protein [Chromatiales bacterium]|nr:DUF11 domain-containing protein [Chromatiales bacterium]